MCTMTVRQMMHLPRQTGHYMQQSTQQGAQHCWQHRYCIHPQIHVLLLLLLWNPDAQCCIQCLWAGLCSSRARWPQATNFCPWANRKTYFLHRDLGLGTPDCIDGSLWALFHSSKSTALRSALDKM